MSRDACLAAKPLLHGNANCRFLQAPAASTFSDRIRVTLIVTQQTVNAWDRDGVDRQQAAGIGEAKLALKLTIGFIKEFSN